MSEIKVIPPDDYDTFTTIVANAYPGMDLSTEEKRERFKTILTAIQEEGSFPYGLYRDGSLMGGMVLYNFTMTMLSVKTLVGGVGLVAVDLLHKREKVCKEMILFFLNHYKEKGACMTSLYPFRPDFYRKMGFGFGTKMHQYVLKPHQLPEGEKDCVYFIGKEEKKALIDCYERYTRRTHGMMEKKISRVERMFENPEVRIAGYKKGDTVLGYIIFLFKKGGEDNFIINDIEIREFIYETREALFQLLAFLHSQKDQVRYIIINTQDEYFHHLFPDPRNKTDHLIPSAYHESNTSGVGIMYRVIDTERVFRILKDHNFQDQDIALRVTVKDSFFPENEGSTIVHFVKGFPFLDRKGCDAEITLDVSDFSSLLMGVVPFKQLYTYGLADISDSYYIDCVTRLFKSEEKPVCTTEF